MCPDDLVVAVCDNAHEQLGRRIPDRLHWSHDDTYSVSSPFALAAPTGRSTSAAALRVRSGSGRQGEGRRRLGAGLRFEGELPDGLLA